jgi:hypothetical protein
MHRKLPCPRISSTTQSKAAGENKALGGRAAVASTAKIAHLSQTALHSAGSGSSSAAVHSP